MFLTPFRISSGTSSGGGGTGMVNGATNVGSGSDIFKQLTGDILEFRGILGDAFITNSVVGDNVVLTFNQSALSIFQGDVGAGGVKGLVPPPAAGDAAAGKFLKADGVWSIPPAGGGGGTGTVTSVGLSAPGTVFTVAGSPINNSGTLALGFVAQNANTFLAGGTTGGASAPNFRTLVTADYPNSSVTYAKIQNIANGSRLLGSSSAGGGPVQEITLGAGLNMSGTTLNTVASGGGDVSGGAFSVDNEIAIYSGGTGKLIKQSGVLIPATNILGPGTGGRSLRLLANAGDNNTVALGGSFGSVPVTIQALGPGPDVGINYITETNGDHTFYTDNPGSIGATGTKSFQIQHGGTLGVNYLTTAGNIAGSAPTLRAEGTDTNISLNLVTKGTGVLMVNGVPLATGGGGDVSSLSAASMDSEVPLFHLATGKIIKSGTNANYNLYRFVNDNTPIRMFFNKSRGTTLGALGAVQDGDPLGELTFAGNDGSVGFWQSVSIGGVVQGFVQPGVIPGSLHLRTAPVTGGGPLTRAIVDNSGRFVVGGVYAQQNSAGYYSGFQIQAPDGGLGSQHIGVWNTAAAVGPTSHKTLSRGSGVGVHGLVNISDIIGIESYLASDGTEFKPGVQVRAVVNGTPVGGNIPAVYTIYTTDGAGALGARVTFHDNGMTLQNGQIHFPASQNPSVGPNALDDYEEGTWTPVDLSSAGLTFAVGLPQYVKVGQFVHVSCDMVYPVNADGAGTFIGGLPFMTQSINGQGGNITYTDANIPMYVSVGNGSTAVNFNAFNGAQISNAQMTSHYARFTAHYRAAN